MGVSVSVQPKHKVKSKAGRHYRSWVNFNELRKDFIYACVKRGLTNADDINSLWDCGANYSQVAGIKAAITKGQLA